MAEQQQDGALLQLLQEWKERKAAEWVVVLAEHDVDTLLDLERCADDAPSWELLLGDLLAARETALRFNLVAWQRDRAGGGVAAAHHPAMQPVALTLRLWVGYEQSHQVTASTLVELRQKTQRVFALSREFRLYWCELDATGVPVNWQQRHAVDENARLGDTLHRGGGVVWVSDGGSPQGSPKKEKPRSPFLTDACAGASFERIPDFHEDAAFDTLCSVLRGGGEDNKVALLFAIPGSGKSRTVREAAKALSYKHLRIKLVDEHRDALRSCVNGEQRDYEQWKTIFQRVVRPIFGSLLEQREGREHVVLHVDDAQSLMSETVVPRNEWDAESGDPWDLVMPSVCSLLASFANSDDNIHVVLSGTNCFGPLVFGGGSEMKEREIPLDGVFSHEWVMRLVDKYFEMPAHVRQQVTQDVEFVRANRRAVEHYLYNAHRCLKEKRTGDEVSVAEAVRWRSAAFSFWSKPVRTSVGSALQQAVRSLALLMFPRAHGGHTRGGALVFKRRRFPEEVLHFALAGGLNVTVAADTVTCQVPFGCVWQLMTEMCCNALHESDLDELQSFVTVARSEPLATGHALERALACELCMLQQEHALYSVFTRSVAQIGRYQADPLCFARPFEYISTIAQDEWPEHTVVCAWGEEAATGMRVVDVGFPLVRVSPSVSTDAPPLLRVMCELKCGYADKPAELWKLCCTFFDKMAPFMRADASVVACFVTETRFMAHEPRKASTTAGNLSAYDARERVQAYLARSSRYVMVEDVCSATVLPLRQLVAREAGLDVDVLTAAVDCLYLGSPDHQLPQRSGAKDE